MRKLLFASIFVLAFCFAAFGQESSCPKISVIGPAFPVLPGENSTFTVILDDKAKDLKVEFLWSVENGKIISGQRTPAIIVGEITPDSVSTATVEIKGLPEGCSNTASETAIFPHCPTRPIEIEQLKTSASRLEKLKFDKLITALENEPTATAYIIIFFDEKISQKKLKQKEQQIRKYLSDTNALMDRVVIVKGTEGEDLIRLFIVPAGAEPPTP